MIIKNGKTISSIFKGSKEIEKIYKGTLVVYEAFKKLIASGVPPLTLTNSIGEDLVDYKIYGNSEQGILPSEYQQVEYIENTGESYFEIDFLPNQNTSSKGKFQITNTSLGRVLFGSRTSSAQHFYGFNWGGGMPYKYYNSYMSGLLVNTPTIDAGVHTFEKRKRELYVDDKLINTHTYTSDWQSNLKLIVFGCNTGGTIGLWAIAKLFYLQIFDGENLAIDLIPCYRKSDEKVGMYDLVNNVFYTNEGSGEFEKGNNMPSPEMPIEVESVGEYDNSIGKYVIPIKTNNTITNIYLNEPLRKMGDYADYIDYENQKVFRLIDKVTFDGSENWEQHTTTTENVGVFRLDGVLTPLIKAPQTATMMTHFAVTNIYSTSSFETGIYRFSSNTDVTQITGTRLYVSSNDANLDDFKTWVSQNKPSLYYPLATPTEETIELPNIPTLKGTTTLEVDTNILPSNMEVTYKGK